MKVIKLPKIEYPFLGFIDDAYWYGVECNGKRICEASGPTKAEALAVAMVQGSKIAAGEEVEE